MQHKLCCDSNRVMLQLISFEVKRGCNTVCVGSLRELCLNSCLSICAEGGVTQFCVRLTDLLLGGVTKITFISPNAISTAMCVYAYST